MDIPLVIAVLVAFALWFAAAITLRAIANSVSEYYSGAASPELGLRVRVLGSVYLGSSLLVGIPSGIAAALGAAVWPLAGAAGPNFRESVTLAVFAFIGIHLAAIGIFLWRWSAVVRQAPPAESDRWSFSDLALRVGFAGPWMLFVTSIRTAERGAAMAWLLSWWTLFVGAILAGVCTAASSPTAVLLLVAWIVVLAITVFFELLASYYRGIHRRHCTLWHIYLAIRSRRPLVQEIEFLAAQSGGRQRERLIGMCDALQEGVDPDDVFAHSAMLSRLEGAYLATGLRAGQLPRVLNDILHRRAEFAQSINQAQNPLISVLYLWVVVLAIHSIVGFISYWIAPKFKKIFDDFGTDLPAMTKQVLQGADAFASYWYLAIPFMTAALVVLTGLTLLPFAGGLSGLRERCTWFWPRICLPDVLRALAVAVQANIPLEEALVPLVRRQFRVPLHNRLIRIQERIRDGEDCWISMADEKFLRPAEAQFLRSAQRAGNLPWALETLGTRFEQRWKFKLLFLFEFLQPAMVLVIGAIVGYLAIAYFLPLVKLINDLA